MPYPDKFYPVVDSVAWVARLALLGAGVTVEAAPITGTITIKGGATLDSTSVKTATKVTG